MKTQTQQENPDGNLKEPSGQNNEQPTKVLPIVGLDVGAIDSSLLLCFGSGWTFAIRLFVFNFNKSFSIELRLPGGGFSTSPPSAILVRWLQCDRGSQVADNSLRSKLLTIDYTLIIHANNDSNRKEHTSKAN